MGPLVSTVWKIFFSFFKLSLVYSFFPMVSGGSVSCVATDDSRAGALAVAGDGGQLLIYMHTQKNSSS